jgi:predicted 3-demethylubiquinone-9 3-methyltransferase (glyoxalase superfamily)
MTVRLEIRGLALTLLNGGPLFKQSEAASLVIPCDTQEEIDRLWEKLGTEKGQCGWQKDKFGVSWQIVPVRLLELMRDPDRAKADRVMAAMLKMSKLDIQELEKAHRGA